MNANIGYEERPTITYMPIEGRDFAVRMLSSIPAETVFAAAKQGWAVDIFMYIGINRIGALENMAFETIPFPKKIDQEKHYQQETEKLKKFRQAIQEMIFLASNEAFEVQLVEENGVEVAFLLFADPAPEGTQSKIAEFKQHLGVAPKQNIFRITERVTGVKEDKISMETRSLSAMMTFLARGVQVPPEHLADGRVIDYMMSTAGSDGTDLISLFRVLAPSGKGAAPMLTLPAG
jgi:hypothetical protein